MNTWARASTRGSRAGGLGRTDLSDAYLNVRISTALAAMAVNLFVAAFGGRHELWLLPLLSVPVAIDGLRRRGRANQSLVGPLTLDTTAVGLFITVVGLGEVAVAYGLLILAATTMLIPSRQLRWLHPYVIFWLAVALVVSRVSEASTRWNPTAEAVFIVIHVSVCLVALSVLVGAVMRRLAASEEQRNRIIGGFTHDIRNALTSAVGMADLLIEHSDDLDPAEIGEYAGLVVAEGTEAAAMTEDLLTVTRAEAGQLTVSPEPVELTAEAAAVVRENATLYGREVGLVLPGRPVVCTGDLVRVRQIIRNLISNARRYGGDEIGVTVGEVDGTAFFRVTDSGSPIPEQERQRIFDAHQRANDRPAHSESVGLGLTISRHLARLMGGDLTYRHFDGWSIFELTLPTNSSAGVSGAVETVETRVETIRLGTDGIMRTRVGPDARIHLKDARAGVAGYCEVADGKRRPLLVDARRLGYLAPEARRHYTRSAEAAACLNAVALLVAGSPIARVVANYINTLGKPPFPTRLFDDEADAVAWLRGHLQTNPPQVIEVPN